MKRCAGQIRYLIAINELRESTDTVRCVNISRHLGVSRPSVSKMLKCLANSGLVYEAFCNSVELTEEGENAVREIYSVFNEVYIFFRKFLKHSHDEAHNQAVAFITEFPQETCDRLKVLVKKTLSKKKLRD